MALIDNVRGTQWGMDAKCVFTGVSDWAKSLLDHRTLGGVAERCAEDAIAQVLAVSQDGIKSVPYQNEQCRRRLSASFLRVGQIGLNLCSRKDEHQTLPWRYSREPPARSLLHSRLLLRKGLFVVKADLPMLPESLNPKVLLLAETSRTSAAFTAKQSYSQELQSDSFVLFPKVNHFSCLVHVKQRSKRQRLQQVALRG